MNILSVTFSRVASLLTGCLLLLLLAMPAAAEEAAPDCSSKSIKTAFDEGQGVKIQKLLKAVGYHPGKIDGLLGPDTQKALVQFCLSFKVNEPLKLLTRQNNEVQVEELAVPVEASTEESKVPVGEMLQIIAGELDQPKEISLSGGGCGCSRDYDENSLVYGFYPFWLADGKKHVVDFSLFKRIGYFALELDAEGDIVQQLHFPNSSAESPNIAELVKTAKKHRVKVDVTFIASNWQNWGKKEGEKESEKRFEKVVNNAVRNIIETVTKKYEGKASPWWRKLPLVENYAAVSADGINLYFPAYRDSGNGGKLVKIVKALNSELKKAKPDARLNIMLGIDLLDIDRRPLNEIDEKSEAEVGEKYKELEREFEKIKGQLQALEKILDAEPKAVDHIFLFLTQDTSQSKKDLRQVIESAFSGEARKTVLRKIVPIVIAQGLGEQRVADQKKSRGGVTQFADDLIYFQDNFAGVGLWHLPLSQDEEAAEAEKAEKEAAAKRESYAIAAAEQDAEAKIAAAKAATEAATVAKIVAAEANAANEVAAKAAAENGSAETKIAAEAAAVAARTANSELAAAEKDALVKITEKNLAENKVEALKKAAADKAEAEKQEPLTDVATIRMALTGIYQPEGEYAFLGDKIQPYAITMCEYACPNRWVFRIVMDVLLGLAFIYALLAVWNCRLRELYRRHLPYFLGFGFLTAAVFTITAVCDPYLRDNAELALIVILLVIIAYLIWLRRRKAAHLP